ncbi:LysR family transcriptional regulator [Clostridium botulinum]|uniref:LysR family transcriptional regulator n=1 Tax=Clostridium botulinum TaxID=1491 RepID=A0A846JBJ2_CLOBO|nr:LysR family transcriptional regulator [Clostridium botulinum]ACA54935.1 putative transcriptional regulator, LysR family [Clostridium botulinum A3 str. Loch Maree]NFH63917.1 LysR family transcriptional regulator [Clostridium botulinum]NFJ07504.1 LysR family transcriptional regulator [Clostridium botulinum]NFK14476.1 LysR family transcriptional regulator [Clostridium botulinum]NFM93949.1 LysR family transcriptional regulator [Clostridium botulinum]
MNYDYYKTFIALAQTKNFSTTAKKLNISQSTVSNRIKELEKYIGSSLLYRTNKTVGLTIAGEEFLPYCKRMILIEEEGMTVLNNLKYKDSIKLGSVHSAYDGHIKRTVKDFLKKHDDISIKILINHSDKLLEFLVDEIIDIAIVSYVPTSNKYTTIHTLCDDIILVAKNTYDFKDEIYAHELKTMKLIYADWSESFEEWLRHLTGGQMNYQIYIDQVNEVFDFVHEGFGYAFVLSSMAEKYFKIGSLKKVRINNVAPYFSKNFIVINKYKANNANIKAFLNISYDTDLSDKI